MAFPESFMRSPNQGGRIFPSYIILHHSEGSWLGDRSWIMNTSSQVSYHYLVNVDGGRVQFVYDFRKAWHAGKSHWKGESGMNEKSVSIAVTGNTNKRDLTSKEILSVVEKVRYLMKKLSIPETNILTHGMISPDRKSDMSQRAYLNIMGELYRQMKRK